MSGKDTSKLQSLIRDALALRESNGNIMGDNIFRAERIEYVLTRRVDVPGYDQNMAEKRALISKTLQALLDVPNATYDQFEKKLNEQAKLLRVATPREYNTVFSLNVPLAEARFLNHIRLGDLYLNLVPYSKVEKQFSYSRTAIAIQRPKIDYRSAREQYAYCVISNRAWNADEAFQEAYRQFETARALINFALLSSSFFSGTPQQRSVVSPSSLMACYMGTELAQSYYTIGNYHYELSTITADVAMKSAKLLRLLDKAQGALRDRLTSSLTLYSEAMDQSDDAYRFLNLYQSLELLLAAQKPGDVARRLKALFEDKGEVYWAIDCLEHQRNLFVHQGKIRNLEQTDVNILKNFIDQAVGLLLGHRRVLTSETQFVEFWNVIRDDNSKLAERRKVIGHLLRLPQS